jgi:hypothetical protein
MHIHSSRQAARRLGLHVATLSKYLVQGKLPSPKSVITGDIKVYLWTDQDIERARELLPKIKNGRKTRYQKKKGTQARVPVPHKKK